MIKLTKKDYIEVPIDHEARVDETFGFGGII
jgi:hypothetical protein